MTLRSCELLEHAGYWCRLLQQAGWLHTLQEWMLKTLRLPRGMTMAYALLFQNVHCTFHRAGLHWGVIPIAV